MVLTFETGGGGLRLLHVPPGESPHGRVLPDVHRGAHRALAVHEESEREAEVGVGRGRRRRRVRASRREASGGGCCRRGRSPRRSLARLHEPLAEADEVAGQETALDEVVEGLEEQGAALVGQARFPGALLAICKEKEVENVDI